MTKHGWDRADPDEWSDTGFKKVIPQRWIDIFFGLLVVAFLVLVGVRFAQWNASVPAYGDDVASNKSHCQPWQYKDPITGCVYAK